MSMRFHKTLVYIIMLTDLYPSHLFVYNKTESQTNSHTSIKFKGKYLFIIGIIASSALYPPVFLCMQCLIVYFNLAKAEKKGRCLLTTKYTALMLILSNWIWSHRSSSLYCQIYPQNKRLELGPVFKVTFKILY